MRNSVRRRENPQADCNDGEDVYPLVGRHTSRKITMMPVAGRSAPRGVVVILVLVGGPPATAYTFVDRTALLQARDVWCADPN